MMPYPFESHECQGSYVHTFFCYCGLGTRDSITIAKVTELNVARNFLLVLDFCG